MSNDGFGVSSPEGVFKKLQLDFEDLKRDPTNAHRLIDFCHTADSIPDHLEKTEMRKHEPLLAIVSHISNQAKHKRVHRHNAVKRCSWIQVVERGFVEPGYFEEKLEIELEGHIAETLGISVIDGISLARRVIDYWSWYFQDEPDAFVYSQH